MLAIIFLIIYVASIVLTGLHVIVYYSKIGRIYGKHPAINEELLLVFVPVLNTIYAIGLWTICFPIPKEKYDVNKHKITNILIYISQLEGLQLSKLEDGIDRPFQGFLLKEAIRKLEVGVHPNKVENWVVKMEKTWRNF